MVRISADATRCCTCALFTAEAFLGVAPLRENLQWINRNGRASGGGSAGRERRSAITADVRLALVRHLTVD